MIDWFQVVTVSLVFLFLFEMLLVSTRASLFNPNIFRTMAGREADPAAQRVRDLVHRHTELDATFHLAQLLCRFLIAGCILALIPGPASRSLAVGEALAALLATGIVLFLVEEFIKAAVFQHFGAWAMRLAPFARGLQTVFAPLVAVAMVLHHPNGDEELIRVTEDELKSLVDAGHQEGVLEKDEREMIYSIFHLGDTLAREIMAPRIYLTALDCNPSI